MIYVIWSTDLSFQNCLIAVFIRVFVLRCLLVAQPSPRRRLSFIFSILKAIFSLSLSYISLLLLLPATEKGLERRVLQPMVTVTQSAFVLNVPTLMGQWPQTRQWNTARADLRAEKRKAIWEDWRGETWQRWDKIHNFAQIGFGLLRRESRLMSWTRW
jgi:hypothetical protein